MLQTFLIVYLLLSNLVGNNTGRPSPIIATDPFKMNETAKIGDNPFPTNPMSDRAIGYLLQGKAQAAISNYGNIINWDEHPMGIWNGYSYLPSVAFLAGVPGHKYSSDFSWENILTN